MIVYSKITHPNPIANPPAFEAKQYGLNAFGADMDPFLMVDWYRMSEPTFGAHPHAGFSAVTYMFEDSENGFRNKDSLGTENDILPGALHWSRAGRGLVHDEFPLQGEGAASGLQIFVNLPEESQLIGPAAFHVSAEDVVQTTATGVKERIAVDGTTIGSQHNAIPNPVRIGELYLEPGASVDRQIPAGWGGLLIVLEGGIELTGPGQMTGEQAVAFRTQDGSGTVALKASDEGARIALLAGQRLEQPIVAYGPFILSSETALMGRIEAYQRGEFGTV